MVSPPESASHCPRIRLYARIRFWAEPPRALLDDIPAGLWREVRAKAKRDGVSIRALILKLLTDWLASETAPEKEG